MDDFANRDGLIWFNGKFLEWRDSHIHVLTHGLHYASSIFEGIRAYNGKIFKLDHHINRFFNSAKILKLQLDFNEQQLKNAIYELLEKQNLKDAYIRPVAFRGSKLLKIAADIPTDIAIAAWEFKGNFYEETVEPINMNIAKWRKPSASCFPYQAKTAANYLTATIEAINAKDKGFENSLFLNDQNYITETTSSNIFLVFNKELHTPTTECALNGITRQTIIEIAKVNNILVIERDILLEELKDAQEVFTTSTASGILAVSRIENYYYNSFSMSSFFRKEYKRIINEKV